MTAKEAAKKKPATKTAALVSVDKQALADCRARIDQIDIGLHDLLQMRADVVDEVRKIKGKQTIYLRPGREASMLRALLARPQGKIAEGLIVRLWREMIGASLVHEGPINVAVYAPEKGPDLWDVSRDYFGSFVPLREAKTAADAIKMLREEKSSMAVLPFPDVGEKDPWWPLLVEDKNNLLTIFAIVPFENLKAGRSNARNSLPSGVVIGRLFPELTGDDRSFLALHTVHVPEAEMRRLLGKAGYKVRQMLLHSKGRGASAVSCVLTEVDGYVGKTDTRLARLRAMMGSRLQYLAPLGGYATPLKNGKR